MHRKDMQHTGPFQQHSKAKAKAKTLIIDQMQREGRNAANVFAEKNTATEIVYI